MSLTADEKQSLIGPLVVGTLFGLFAAFCVLAFGSDYGANVYSHSRPLWLSIAVDALIYFGCVVGASVLLLGVVPIALRRIAAFQSGGNDA